MLCIMVDGTKLPPYVVFKRKTMLKITNSNVSGVIVHVQKWEWMDETVVADWIKRMWLTCPDALLKQVNMLVLGSFEGYTAEVIKNIFKTNNTDQVIIPGRLTSILYSCWMFVLINLSQHLLKNNIYSGLQQKILASHHQDRSNAQT